MNVLSKKIIAALVLLAVSGYSFGYDYGVTNDSDKTLLVKLQLESELKPNHRYEIVKPHTKAIFRFGDQNAFMCLQSLYVAPYEGPQKKNEEYAITSIDMVMIPKKIQDEISEHESNESVIAKIMKTAKQLYATSLCTNRDFTVRPTGKKVVRKIGNREIPTNLDQYIAYTFEG